MRCHTKTNDKAIKEAFPPMKLMNFWQDGEVHVGVITEQGVADLTAAVKACGFGTRAVSATQSGGKYAFTGVPKRLDAGVVAVTMTNRDADPHERVVLRKNDGEKRSVQELLALPDDGVMGAGTPAGATFAVPGAEAVGLLRLTAGNYLYFCPIPIGGTEGAPPHFTNGMYGEFTVG